MPDTLLLSDQEKRVKFLKRQIEQWRECLVALHPILIWEKPWYPAAITGTISIFFLLYWRCDPPIITAISLLFIILNLVDYIVPKLCVMFCTPQQWTAAKEKKFETICESLVKTQDKIFSQIARIKDLKQSNPKTYFISILLFCSLTAWMGYLLNNWIVGYTFVVLIILYPGAKHNQLIDQLVSGLLHRVTEIIRNYTQKETPKTK